MKLSRGRIRAEDRPPGMSTQSEVARALGVSAATFLTVSRHHQITPDLVWDSGRAWYDLERVVALYNAKVRRVVDAHGAGQNLHAKGAEVAEAAATTDEAPADDAPDPRLPAGFQRAGETYAEARTRFTVATANKAELDVQVRRGELVERDTVHRALEAVGVGLRDQLMSLGARLAGQLASETEPRRIREILEDACREALQTAAANIRRTVPGATDGEPTRKGGKR